jgi:hypothetical protein
MSHISDVEMFFDDITALKATCAKRGWQFVDGKTTYPWVGKWFDDSPVPRSLFAEEDEYRRVVAMSRADRTRYMEEMLGRCEHAIKVPGHACEVGVVRVGEHLKLAWDWASTLKNVMGSMDSWGRDDLAQLSPFLQDYVKCSWTSEFNKQGGVLVGEEHLADGSLLLEYEVM